MRLHPFGATALLFSLFSAASAQEASVVLEGATIKLDPASLTATATPCPKCKPVLLKLTDKTEIFVNGKRQPFTLDTEIAGPVDTKYQPSDMTVIWFRPLSFRR